MNYRRGFQRVYIVVSIMWVTVMFFAIFSDSFKPWPAIKVSEWDVVSVKPLPPPLPADFVPIPPSEAEQRAAEERVSRELLARKWGWSLGLSILPAVILYFVVFDVSRWIYRGFRTS